MIELIQTGEVARRLGVSPEYVRQLARRGTLPVAGMTPRGVRLFTREAIEKLAREREAPRAGAVS